MGLLLSEQSMPPLQLLGVRLQLINEVKGSRGRKLSGEPSLDLDSVTMPTFLLEPKGPSKNRQVLQNVPRGRFDPVTHGHG